MDELEAAFEQHRRELHVHCYRMLASYDDAEDAVQEAFLRAWRARGTFDGEHPRAWLYRIATNVCLDRGRERRARSGAEVGWLTPYPDTVLDDVPAVADQPDRAYVARETMVEHRHPRLLRGAFPVGVPRPVRDLRGSVAAGRPGRSRRAAPPHAR
jgi:RNA polymerase sigma factor (sigma-70 family)